MHSIFSPPGSDNLEGMLGTGQYLILPGETDLTIVQDMVTRFDRYAQGAGLSTTSAAALGMTPYQVITVASIIEKEGYYTFNMPKVARVIYNRLANDMPLQMDSTVLYAIGQDGGPVTSKDLQIQSPYNTYLNKGLTPTPICMPSVTALKSALNPPAGAWLYFVLVQKNGVMAFSDTFAEQLANEQSGEVPWPPLIRAAAAGPGTADDGGGQGPMRTGRPRRRRDRQPGRPLAVAAAAQQRLRCAGPRRDLALASPSRWHRARRRPRSTPCAAPTSPACRSRCRTRPTSPHWSTSAATWHAGSTRSTASSATDGRLLGTNTDGEGFVASLARGAGFEPDGQAVPRHRRRRRGPGGRAGPGRRPAPPRSPS